MLSAPDSPCVDGIAASPNHGERVGARSPDSVILHYTGMASGEAALQRLCAPESQVSSHYLVFECGRVVQLVPESRRAWHAGESCWHGETDLNSASIGIEIVNSGHPGAEHSSAGSMPSQPGECPDFPSVQIDAVIALLADIVRRHAIRPERVLAHSDIAPGRKIDPGEKFPWRTLADAGLGLWVAPAPIEGGRFLSLGDVGAPVEALQALLTLYGYALEAHGRFDEHTRSVVEAFQRHFRPARVDGVADASTIKTLHALVRRLDRQPA